MRTAAASIKRLSAFGADLIILGAVQAFGASLGGALGAFFQSLITRDSDLISQAAISGTQWGGTFWFTAAFILNFGVLQGLTGATLGKGLFQLQTLTVAGEFLGVRMALFRSILYLYSMLPLYLGIFVLLFHPRRQAIHDLILDTMVFDRRAFKKSQSLETPKVIYLPDRAA